MNALTLCNACDARPMAPGQEAPGAPGYCAACMRLAREGVTGRCTYCRAPVDTGAGRLVLNPDGTRHTCPRPRVKPVLYATATCRCGHPRHGGQCPAPDGCWCDTFTPDCPTCGARPGNAHSARECINRAAEGR